MANKRFLFLAAVVLLALVACSAAEKPPAEKPPAEEAPEQAQNSLTEGINFQSIDEIVDADLLVTNFAKDGTASLPIQSSIPVACTIVYGTTPEFGSLSLDQDMADGTHSDHNPLLSGLEPETEYYFRVQGVDEDGTIYLSEIMTFTTPAQDTSQSENLASADRGAEIVGFSSAFGDAGLDDRWGAGSAFDDNPNSEWSSAGDGDEAWIEVKLAGPALVSSIEFRSRAMADGSAITEAFTITTDQGQLFGPFSLPDPDNGYSFDIDAEAETLRFELVETSGGNTGVVDIIVYGKLLSE